jgi:hypothetical protein
LPSSLTPEVAKTTGVFYEMARWFSNRPFLVMFTPPLAVVRVRRGKARGDQAQTS